MVGEGVKHASLCIRLYVYEHVMHRWSSWYASGFHCSVMAWPSLILHRAIYDNVQVSKVLEAQLVQVEG
jgi:hypothetical protein